MLRLNVDEPPIAASADDGRQFEPVWVANLVLKPHQVGVSLDALDFAPSDLETTGTRCVSVLRASLRHVAGPVRPAL